MLKRQLTIPLALWWWTANGLCFTTLPPTLTPMRTAYWWAFTLSNCTEVANCWIHSEALDSHNVWPSWRQAFNVGWAKESGRKSCHSQPLHSTSLSLSLTILLCLTFMRVAKYSFKLTLIKWNIVLSGWDSKEWQLCVCRYFVLFFWTRIKAAYDISPLF